MMDLLTTKQWFFLACISYGLIVYFGFQFWHELRAAKKDRVVIAALILKLGRAIGVDLTKEDK